MQSICSTKALAAGAIFLLAGCAGETPAESAVASQDIPALMAAAKTPGLAIATIENCNAPQIAYFGVADVEKGEAVDANTVFEAASLTKPLFALIVMQLVDEGVIDLDRPLAEDFAYPRVTDQAEYAVLTPRIILMHRSGFPNWASDPLDPETWNDIEFKNPPGEKFGYSGEAYLLLQAYVEDATGKPLAALFDERLGVVMPMTSLVQPKEGAALAYGHDSEGGKEKGREMITTDSAIVASSANTTAGDYAAFARHLFCDGGDLTPGTRNEMLRPQSQTSDEKISWGLGWGVLTGAGGVYFHWGDNGHFKSFVAFNPATKDGIVFFANAKEGLRLIEPLAEPIVGDLDPAIDWLDYGRLEAETGNLE